MRVLICKVCGKGFESNQPNSAVCSAECKRKRNAERVRNSKVAKEFICKNCSKPFHPRGLDRTTFCSRDCAFAFKAARALPKEKIVRAQRCFCKNCGAEFVSAALQSYCSEECRKKTKCDQSRTSNAEKKTIRQIFCRECGQPFINEYGNKRNVFCSIACSRRYNSRIRKQRTGSNHRSRARHYGVAYEPFNTKAVFERDNWRCGICGKPIAKDKKCPHPLSPTIDHIIALADGGAHIKSNVQAAHFICNSYKGAKSQGQLRLFG